MSNERRCCYHRRSEWFWWGTGRARGTKKVGSKGAPTSPSWRTKASLRPTFLARCSSTTPSTSASPGSLDFESGFLDRIKDLKSFELSMFLVRWRDRRKQLRSYGEVEKLRWYSITNLEKLIFTLFKLSVSFDYDITSFFLLTLIVLSGCFFFFW